MQAISFDQWQSDIVQGIESSAHNTEKGDRFVKVILRDRYQLSEDDVYYEASCVTASLRKVLHAQE